MCGICGFYHYKTDEPINLALLKAMMASLKHRGPDEDGFYHRQNVGLGMQRLSIIDLKGGRQPIANEDQSCWIVFNGEIYNFPQLRQNLKSLGHNFRTLSDTETILHAYEEWGLSAFNRLNGMFGLAIWDERKQELILARDHFGVKPLYYFDDGKRLIFSSEIKAIFLNTNVVREVDEQALDLYLTFRFVPSPKTLFRGIFKIPPGHYLICNANGFQLVRFFCEPPAESDHTRKESDLVDELRYLLITAVQRQMISDVPVGALLSGGVDSTTIVTLMRNGSGEPIHTFTVGFADQGNFNELDAAQESARRLNTHHHQIILSAKDYIRFWPKAMWHLEEPLVTPSAIPMFFVSKLAREYVKVVLTGQGADEPWAGYRRYYGEQWANAYQHLPTLLRKNLISPIADTLPRSSTLKRAVRSLGETDPAERFTNIYSVFTPAQKILLYNKFKIGQTYKASDSVRVWQRDVSHLDGLAQMMYVDARFSLSDDLLLYGDKMAMAVSLEARVPMLDLELMRFVESLPSNMRLRGRTHKYLYRKSISTWLPSEIIRSPKRGFDTPMDQWLARDLQSYARSLWFSSESASRSFFNLNYLERLLQEHASRRIDNRRQIFCLLSLEIWHRIFIKQQFVEDLSP